jgi:phosphoglycerol transferase
VDYEDRTLYNCFINADLPTERGTVGREFTAMDMFPTTLAALGFTIEGDRLGLGTNLFSDRPTLCEEMGYDGFVEAASRYSAYYIQRLCPELASKVELVTETETETLPVTVTQP